MIALLNKKQFQFGFFTGIFILSSLAAIYTELYYVVAVPFLILLLFAGWQYFKILFFLLVFTLPLSFEYSFSQTLGTDVPDEMLMLLVSGFFLFYWIYSPKIIPKNILQHPLVLLLAAVMLWMIITVIFSSQKIISLKYLLAKCWYLGAFVLAPLVVLRQKQNIKIIGIVTGTSMFLVAIISLWRHSGYAFRFANINNALTPFFRNHVTYSAMLVCVIPIFFAFYRLTHSKKQRNYIVFAIVILLTALFFSYARGAWLALAAGLVAYQLIKKRNLVIVYFTAIVLTISLLFWVKSNDRYLQFTHDYKTTIFHKDFAEHLIATYRLKDVSTAERFYRWIAGVRMIKERPLIGYGPSTFYNNYRNFTIPTFKTWVSKNEDHSTAHNYFLLTVIEQGIPGLIFFLTLLGAMFYYSQYLYHRIQDAFYKTVSITAGVILVMITMVNFLSDLIETDKIGSLFFLCLSVLIVSDVNTRFQPKDNSDSTSHIQSIP